MNRALRHLTAAVSAIAGSTLLSVTLVAMNAKAHRSKEVKKDLTAAIEVTEQKKPPKKKSLPKPKPKPRPTRSRPAPRPSFSSNLAGLGAGIPVFSASDLGGLESDPLAGQHAVEDMVMTADTVDAQPSCEPPARCPAPQPPSRAIKRGLTGTVRARFLVTKDGSLENIRIVDSEPEGLFDDAVIAALEQWQMTPATYGGQPVAVSFEAPFRFQ